MSLAQAEIPSDPAALHAFAKALQVEIALRDAEIYDAADREDQGATGRAAPGALWPLVGEAGSRHRTA